MFILYLAIGVILGTIFALVLDYIAECISMIVTWPDQEQAMMIMYRIEKEKKETESRASPYEPAAAHNKD